MINLCLNLFLYFFAFIGLFITICSFTRVPGYKTVCEYKNGYTYNDHRACLIKNGCGIDGSLCSEQKPLWFCPEPEVECKIVKNYDL